MEVSKCTHIEFEGDQQSVDSLINRARYYAQNNKNREAALEIVVHLQDAAIEYDDSKLKDTCRELMALLNSPSHYQPRKGQTYAADANSRPKNTSSLSQRPKKWEIDEQRLRNHFKPGFKGEVRNSYDQIPSLICVIQSASDDIHIGRIALQIYESKFFFRDNYKTFKSWYREFCAILNTGINPNYEKNKFKIPEQEQKTTYFFLHSS
ncbi:MAG: hypothetical protein Q4E32_03190 [Bacteroidales bacterium]|nr:hypothetical protein [Bacteroidales bacterium]